MDGLTWGLPGPARGDALLRGALVQLQFVCGETASSQLSPGLLPGDAPSHRRLHKADPAAHAVGSRFSPAHTRHCDHLTVITQVAPFDPHCRLSGAEQGEN